MDHHQQMNHILYVGLIGGVSSGLVGGVLQQCKQQQKKHQHHESSMMNYYSSYDVLNGRGQGVQRHPGNVNYRILVFVNKGLYASCPRTDKIKISRAIVHAVRELGGRFLELDESSGVYHDIGDKCAVEKTSQALREKQTQIRQKLYRQNSEQSILCEMSTDGYASYSMKVLQRLQNGQGIGGSDLEYAWAAASHQQKVFHHLVGIETCVSTSYIDTLPALPAVSHSQLSDTDETGISEEEYQCVCDLLC